MGRLLFSIALVIIGITLGYLIRLSVNTGRIQLPVEGCRRALQKAALLFFNPVAILGATWVADIDNVKIAIMPFLGMTALFAGGLTAWFSARLLNLNRKQTGSFVVCGGFTNIGSLGALFCFILLGEKGFALVPFYKLFEETIYYAVGFPIAKSFSRDLSRNPSFFSRIKDAVSDKFVLTAVTGIGIGLVLNLSGISRPPVYASVNAVFIPLAAFLLLLSIGMAMRFSSAKTYIRPGLVITALKFLIIPCIISGIGFLTGLDKIYGGLPLKVALILSSMPVGFIAMVPPTIYDLDIDIANACWLITNGVLLIYIPVLSFLVMAI